MSTLLLGDFGNLSHESTSDNKAMTKLFFFNLHEGVMIGLLLLLWLYFYLE